MANLAIRGHATHGEEVIKILEMLGGVNRYRRKGNVMSLSYYIGSPTHIYSTKEISPAKYSVFTLEEFLENFPYKVGDRVLARGSAGEITDMKWQGDSFFTRKEGGEVVYTVMLDTEEEITFLVEDLQPYKEQETMEDNSILNQLSELVKETELDSKTFADGYDQGYDDGQHDITEWNLPNGFIFKDENGNVINANKIVLEKKKPKYPKTYAGCCEIIHSDPNFYVDTHLYSDKLESLYKLLISRDAYWKIAGEEMGLGKPWEPDYIEESFEQGCPSKYVIYYTGTNITKERKCTPSYILSFPTAEMRDTFYKNFRDLIERCKELL